MIYLLTGDIRTGKTTSIYLACNKRYDVGGFLTPDEGDKRVIYDIHNKRKYPFQVDHLVEESTIQVGRFTFLLSAFDKGKELIEHQLKNDNIKYIVLDEIGKLELKDQGFHPLVKKLLSINLSQDLIFVVRSFLLEEVIKKYKLNNFKVIDNISQVL